jgi:hypothetical protein
LQKPGWLAVFLPVSFPVFVPAWGPWERILGCLGKGSRVRYLLEPVWGLLGFFRDGRMVSGGDLGRLALQRWFWSLLFWDWTTVGGGSRLLLCNYRGTHLLTVALCRGSPSLAIPVFFGFGHGPELFRGGSD